MRSFSTFRGRGVPSYDGLGRRTRASGFSRAILTLHYRSEALARGAIVALPSFDSAWFGPSGPNRQVVIVIVLAVIAVAGDEGIGAVEKDPTTVGGEDVRPICGRGSAGNRRPPDRWRTGGGYPI